jgi:hypothetical protein
MLLDPQRICNFWYLEENIKLECASTEGLHEYVMHIGQAITELKKAVFWVVAPCSLLKVYQRFRGPCCLHHPGDYEGSKDL